MFIVLKYAIYSCFSLLGLEYTMQIICYFVGGIQGHIYVRAKGAQGGKFPGVAY
jgi:hypothetical protein